MPVRTILGFLIALTLCGCAAGDAERREVEDKLAVALAQVEELTARAAETEARLAEAQSKLDALMSLETLRKPAKEPRAETPAERRLHRAVCLNRLKQLSQLAMVYAQDRKNVYPLAAGPQPASHASLQKLADSIGRIDPKLFVCPASPQSPAVRDERGRLTLTPETSSYAWIGQKTKLTSPGNWALAACTHHADDGGFNVVYVGTNAEWVESEELPKRLVDHDGQPIRTSR